MKLLSDLIVENIPTNIVENAEGKKDLYLEGVFLQDTIKNQNGRVYPKPIMAEAVGIYNKVYISANRAMGELNHPATPQVNAERACIKIESLIESGTDWLGKAKTTNTPLGQLVKGLVIDDGIQLGVSSRGVGSVKESVNSVIVQRGYGITAVDVVSEPSAPNAFVNGIMENREWIFIDGVLVEQEIDAAKHIINKLAKLHKLDEAINQFSLNDWFGEFKL